MAVEHEQSLRELIFSNIDLIPTILTSIFTLIILFKQYYLSKEQHKLSKQVARQQEEISQYQIYLQEKEQHNAFLPYKSELYSYLMDSFKIDVLHSNDPEKDDIKLRDLRLKSYQASLFFDDPDVTSYVKKVHDCIFKIFTKKQFLISPSFVPTATPDQIITLENEIQALVLERTALECNLESFIFEKLCFNK